MTERDYATYAAIESLPPLVDARLVDWDRVLTTRAIVKICGVFAFAADRSLLAEFLRETFEDEFDLDWSHVANLIH